MTGTKKFGITDSTDAYLHCALSNRCEIHGQLNVEDVYAFRFQIRQSGGKIVFIIVTALQKLEPTILKANPTPCILSAIEVNDAYGKIDRTRPIRTMLQNAAAQAAASTSGTSPTSSRRSSLRTVSDSPEATSPRARRRNSVNNQPDEVTTVAAAQVATAAASLAMVVAIGTAARPSQSGNEIMIPIFSIPFYGQKM